MKFKAKFRATVIVEGELPVLHGSTVSIDAVRVRAADLVTQKLTAMLRAAGANYDGTEQGPEFVITRWPTVKTTEVTATWTEDDQDGED